MGSIAINAQGRPKITRKPYFRLEFTNGAILYFRPAGPYGDAFRSLHVDRVWVDEAAWLSEKAWKALRQCLNAGGRLRIYSTPNGLRDTTYYRLTLSDQFTVFRWPSWLNPNWGPEREAELLEFYGGRETAGWQHEVAGEHGKPSYGAFNLENFNLCRQEVMEYRKIVITGEELRDCQSEEEATRLAPRRPNGEIQRSNSLARWQGMAEQEIQKRTFEFARRVLRLARVLDKDRIGRLIVGACRQLSHMTDAAR